MSDHGTHIVDPAMDGQRLDKVLEPLLPDAGLRLRRRLCDDGRVLVDGRKRNPGYKVRAGQEIVLIPESASPTPSELGIHILHWRSDFAALFKPGGVHSAMIQGRDEPSVEGVLDQLFPDNDPVLLNRLDNSTSGLLMVAMDLEAAGRYQQAENGGGILKYYRALVNGRFDGMTTVKNELDTADRKKTRVLDRMNDDPRRWTDVQTLSHDRAADTTEVRCLISKGARHQIRAHLAHLGLPIVGDELYGRGEPGGLMLCHTRISFEDVDFTLPPRFRNLLHCS